MFNFNRLWEEYGLEFLASLSLMIIIILFFVNYASKKKGTYTNLKFFRGRGDNGGKSEWTDKYPKNVDFKEHNEKDSKLELQSKVILEHIFKRPFVKVRPDFLHNDVTGYNLELDLYNEELKLAVEVNGDQHYKFIQFFHRNHDAFVKQRYRDEMKKLKCRQEGIILIDVPYSVGEKGLKPYLLKRLRMEGFLM
jgi:hypothetical protein